MYPDATDRNESSGTLLVWNESEVGRSART